MALTAQEIEQQKKQAEELLFSEEDKLGFAKSLFFGNFAGRLLFPYPGLSDAERPATDKLLADLRRLMVEHIDPVAIDRNAEIPREVIHGLGAVGLLGMTVPVEYGGRGLSQLAFAKAQGLLAAHCAATSVFVNVQHSMGIRALLLFGTDEQRRRWLPDLVAGRALAAFALTETEAGSDAGNVQTTATPSADGKTFILNGTKRFITNGGIAQMLIVVARTPDGKLTAFLVTPDMRGFEVVEERMSKCGIRGTATGRLAFHDMPVPAENIVGPPGKGLRCALTLLDFGRTTFGAGCAGIARACLDASVKYANTRVQFKQTLGEFELVKKKIASMAAHVFAMEAVTAQCAAFIDRGADDYMVETAILKVFATEHLWTIINDTIQIHGGMAYFTDQPFERWMRDARINTIGEGSNDVLKVFISAVGLRSVGESLRGVLDALKHPIRRFGTLLWFGAGQLASRFTAPDVPVQSRSLYREARTLAKRVRDFGRAIPKVLAHLRKCALRNRTDDRDEELLITEQVMKRQYLHERIADAALDLYAASCTLSRLDHLLANANGKADSLERDVQAGRAFLGIADRRIQRNLAALWDNDDADTTKTADAFLT